MGSFPETEDDPGTKAKTFLNSARSPELDFLHS